jgi:hypothetical protein
MQDPPAAWVSTPRAQLFRSRDVQLGSSTAILAIDFSVLVVTAQAPTTIHPARHRLSTGGSNMFTSTSRSRRAARAIVAGAVVALSLSVAGGAFAQAANPPANTPVIAPKQVAAWTVIGWSQGYCSAERGVPGATASGGTLQFVIIRRRIGYAIALAAPEWELKPQTIFPIEVIAQPVFRSDANAVVTAPKVVLVEFGADGQFMKKLAIAPMMEIKAAQATFKLPMEKFADALAELDTCFGSLKLPTANPFAAPEPAAKTASRATP